jgi:hypothetical protein
MSRRKAGDAEISIRFFQLPGLQIELNHDSNLSRPEEGTAHAAFDLASAIEIEFLVVRKPGEAIDL